MVSEEVDLFFKNVDFDRVDGHVLLDGLQGLLEVDFALFELAGLLFESAHQLESFSELSRIYSMLAGKVQGLDAKTLSF